jgi:sugar (pentulose or hexulose) kinase
MIIGLDLGTTSTSAVLFDTKQRVAVCSAECANDAGIAGLPEACHEQAALAGFLHQVAEQIGGVTLSLPEVFDRMQGFAATTDANGLCADTRIAGEPIGGTLAGSIAGINTVNFTPANLVRAFANGIAGELAGAAREMPLDGIKGLVVVGQAAQRNPLLVKALEKQFGVSCRVIASGGESALGVARLAAHLNAIRSL